LNERAKKELNYSRKKGKKINGKPYFVNTPLGIAKIEVMKTV